MLADFVAIGIVASIVVAVYVLGRQRVLRDDRMLIGRLIDLNRASPRPGMAAPDARYHASKAAR